MDQEQVMKVTRDELDLLVGEAKFVQDIKIKEQSLGILKALGAAFGNSSGK